MTSSPKDFPTQPEDLAAYVDQTARLLGLEIPPERRSSVVAHFEHVWQVAQPVLAFELPDDLESAPVFEP